MSALQCCTPRLCNLMLLRFAGTLSIAVHSWATYHHDTRLVRRLLCAETLLMHSAHYTQSRPTHGVPDVAHCIGGMFGPKSTKQGNLLCSNAVVCLLGSRNKSILCGICQFMSSITHVTLTFYC